MIRRKTLILAESWKKRSDAEIAKNDYKAMDKSIRIRIKKEGVWYNVYTNLR